MESKERRKVEEEEDDSPRAGGDIETRAAQASEDVESLKGERGQLHYDVRMTRDVPRRRMVSHGEIVAMKPPAQLTGEPARPSEDERLSSAIDAALKEIDASRIMARSHDEEIARLGEETRRLIAEMQRDLNLKAA